jgi:putative ABC transport system permease protein
VHLFWRDFSYALRRQFKSPGFAAAVVVTLALGIGVNTAVFTVVDSVLLRPLPFRDPDRLVVLWQTQPDHSQASVSYPDFRDWQGQAPSFEQIAFHGAERFTLERRGESEKVAGEWVSSSYLPALGVKPALGRTFLPEEDARPGAAPVAILGHALWQRLFQGDRGALGQTIQLNKVPLTIVGVMPEGFRGFGGGAEVFVPVTMFESLLPALKPYHILEDRNTHWGEALGRLRPGADVEQGKRDLALIASRLAGTYPDTNAGWGVSAGSAVEMLLGDLRPKLLRLFGAVLFVLLIACANVANLLSARAMARSREMALRVTLGARRGSIMSELLAESLLLAVAGGALGLLLVRLSLGLLLATLPLQVPGFVQVGLDARVLAFTLGVSLLCCLLCGLVPALKISRPDLGESLKDTSKGSTGSRASRRARGVLVVADVALALMLMIGAGLMIRSLERIQSFDPGFRPRDLLSLRFEPPVGASDPERLRLKREILAQVESTPGVRSAALTSHLLYDAGHLQYGVTPEGQQSAGPEQPPLTVQSYFVSTGYFPTLGIPVKAGRLFTSLEESRGDSVVLVNQALAKRVWGSPANAVGRRLKVGKAGTEAPWLTVLGVVGDVRSEVVPGSPDALPQMYLPCLRDATWGYNLVVRAAGAPAALAPSLRRAIGEVSASVPVYNVATMTERMAGKTSDTRFVAGMMALFALLGLMLAVIGLYSLLSYIVSQQRREIGVRMALGAATADVLRLVIGRGMRLTAVGIGLGLAASITLAKLLASLLFNVSATDLVTFLAMPLVLGLTALLACYLPARRAARVDPQVSLRYE